MTTAQHGSDINPASICLKETSMLKARLLAAASAQIAPPPAFADGYNMESSCGLFQGSTFLADLYPTICAGSSNTYYAMDSVNGHYYAWIVTRSTSYTSLSSPLSVVATPNAATTTIVMDSVDATHFVTAYQDPTTNNQIDAQYITNTTGTLSVTVTQTTIATTSAVSTNATDCAVLVLDSSNALVLAAANISGGGNNVMSLFNPTTLSVTQNSTAVSQLTLHYENAYFMAKLSATRAIVSWADDSTGALKLASIDVVSGTSFTCNSAVSVGFTGTAGFGASVIGISNTEALIIYRKSTTVIGARTVTVGAGGSITINTEATTTTPINMAALAFTSIAAYGSSSYICSYVSAGGEAFLRSISVNVTGTTVVFDSVSNQILVSSNNTIAANSNNIAGKIIPVDSTHVAMAYSVNIAANVNANTAYTGVIDINPANNTWGTFAGNNSGLIALGSTISTNNRNTGPLWIGTNRVIAGANAPGSSLQYYGFDSTAGSSAYASFSSAATDTGLTIGISTSSTLAFDSVNGTGARFLTAYASASETITTRVVTVAPSIGMVLRTAVTFATAVGSTITTNQIGYYTLVPLTGNKGLFLNYDAVNGYSGNIITTTTGNQTISSAGTNAAIITIAGDTMDNGINFLQYSVIDSTHVAVLFHTQTTSGSKFNLKMCILDLTSGTPTAGAITNVYTGYTNPSNGFGISTLGNGTGIVWYTNDVAAPGTTLFANGFTYSGTTITLGSQSTVATSQSMQQLANGNKSMIAVSGTEAMMGVVNFLGSFAQMRLLTYVNINSITGGSLVQSASMATNRQFGLIPTDNPNNTFMMFGDTQYQQYYRG